MGWVVEVEDKLEGEADAQIATRNPRDLRELPRRRVAEDVGAVGSLEQDHTVARGEQKAGAHAVDFPKAANEALSAACPAVGGGGGGDGEQV
jgi:hypothetical protein